MKELLDWLSEKPMRVFGLVSFLAVFGILTVYVMIHHT